MSGRVFGPLPPGGGATLTTLTHLGGGLTPLAKSSTLWGGGGGGHVVRLAPPPGGKLPKTLQRDCMVSMPAIRASQPSSPRALVHSLQQVALVRARDAAAELELSCGPSTTQLEAAEDQGRWAPAM